MKIGDILVFLYFLSDICINIINSRKESSVFTQVATYNGLKCTTVIFEYNVSAEMACTSICLERAVCVGVHYSRTTMLCTGCGPLDGFNNETTADTNYFHKCAQAAISDNFNGSNYTLITALTNFATAKSCCHVRLNSFLVHFDNIDEIDFVNGLATEASISRYYIGLKYDTTDSKWKWEDDNTEPTFFYWAPGQPDGHQNCVTMSFPAGEKWGDYFCFRLVPYVCEKRQGL